MSKKRKMKETHAKKDKLQAIRISSFDREKDTLIVPSLLPDKEGCLIKTVLTSLVMNYPNGDKCTVKLPFWTEGHQNEVCTAETPKIKTNFGKFLTAIGFYKENCPFTSDFVIEDLMKYMHQKAETYKGSSSDLDIKCTIVFASQTR